MYNLRGGFLVRPLTIALALGCAGAFLSWLEEPFPEARPGCQPPSSRRTPTPGRAGHSGWHRRLHHDRGVHRLRHSADDADAGIHAVLAAHHRQLFQDRVTQWTLGIFLGTFSYCMAALPAARSLPHPFAPVVTVMGAMLLALACVGWLLFFIHHISQAISVNHIVDRIAAETEGHDR